MVATVGYQNGKIWHLAPTLQNLFDETDLLFPDRRTISDGSIGDAAHQARFSDHNPGVDQIVSAGDLTDDNASGCDVRLLVDHLVETKDERVKYLIHEGMIVKSYGEFAWIWRDYDGPNGHFLHAHISVLDDQLYAKGTWWPPKADDPAPKRKAGDMAGTIYAVTDVGSSFVIMPDGPQRISEAQFWELAPSMTVVPMVNSTFTTLVQGERRNDFTDTPKLA